MVDGIDTERLLVNLSETLASANVMVSDLAFELEGSRRHFALGIQQMIELSELLANRTLDKVDPRDSANNPVVFEDRISLQAPIHSNGYQARKNKPARTTKHHDI